MAGTEGTGLSNPSAAGLANPNVALTGVPTAPTAAVDTNTLQLATTAFVIAQAASASPLIDGSAAVGSSTRFARGDHVHPTDTTRQALGTLQKGAWWQPSTNNLLAANFDPATVTTSGGTDGSGVYHLLRIDVPAAITVANMCFLIGTAAVTPTTNRNVCALYSSAGALVAYTADQTWPSTGFFTASLANVVTSLTLTPGTYIAMVQALASGTNPTFFRRPNTAVGTNFAGNAGLVAGTDVLRAAQLTGQGASATPNTFAIASTAGNAKDIWIGLS